MTYAAVYRDGEPAMVGSHLNTKIKLFADYEDFADWHQRKGESQGKNYKIEVLWSGEIEEIGGSQNEGYGIIDFDELQRRINKSMNEAEDVHDTIWYGDSLTLSDQIMDDIRKHVEERISSDLDELEESKKADQCIKKARLEIYKLVGDTRSSNPAITSLKRAEFYLPHFEENEEWYAEKVMELTEKLDQGSDGMKDDGPVDLKGLSKEEKLKNITEFWEEHGTIGFLKLFRGQMLERMSDQSDIPRDELEDHLKEKGALRDIEELKALLEGDN